MNFSQYRLISCATLISIITWFLVPMSFFVLGEWRINTEISSISSLKRGPLEYLAFYLDITCMGINLILGPIFLGFFVRKCSNMLNLEDLPTPKRHWMIWLSTPILMSGILMDTIQFSVVLQRNYNMSWEVATILSWMPNIVLSLMSSLVKTSVLLISCSVLTLLINKFDQLINAKVELEHVWNLCETYEKLSYSMSPYFLLVYATSASTIMMSSFIFYHAWGDLIVMVSRFTIIMNESLIIMSVTLLADDFYDVTNKLILYFR